MNRLWKSGKILFLIVAANLSPRAFSESPKAAAGKASLSRKEKIASSKMVTDKETGTAPEWNLSGGIVLGWPTGFVLKNEFAADQAVDFGLSYSFNKMFVFYGDWQYRFPGALKSLRLPSELSKIEAYAGIGAALLLSSSGATNNPIKKESRDSSLGILFRIPLGLQYRLDSKPLVFFFELVPGLGIVPGTFAYFGAGLGARYYF